MVRELTKEEVDRLLSLKREDLNMDLIKSMFACVKGKENPLFNTFDRFTLPARKLYNKIDIDTTIGRYIINFFVFPEKYLAQEGYQNIVLTADAIKGIEADMGNMVLNDTLSTKEYAKYLDDGEWMSLGTAYFLVPTMDYDINVPIPEVIARRDELFDIHAAGVKSGDPDVAKTIETEVLALAKQKIKDKGNQGYDFFDSGEFEFANNYKKTSIMTGTIENMYTHELDILKSNYITGIDKKEFPKFASLTVLGGYSRGIETESSGYETKKINNAMQSLVLDAPGSDCGTTQYLETEINNKIKGMYVDRYILDPGSSEADAKGLVLLTTKNIKNYVGKRVKMRSPMFCKSDKICNKCAGELFYKLGMKNAGLLSTTMSGNLMNLSLKKFHDSTIQFTKIVIDDYIVKH